MHRINWIAALALLLIFGWSSAPQGSELVSVGEGTQLDLAATEVNQSADAADGEAASKDEVVKDASSEKAAPVKGSAKKGKYYFKKSCKECHGKKGEGGEVTPISKTIKQWERFFKKGIHYEEQPIDSLGTAAELIHIQTFVVAHAADSDQPETCK